MKFNKVTFILMIFLFGIYWIWWFPGPRVATDISLVSQSVLKSQMDVPQTWFITGTEGLGEYAVFTLWSWPFSFVNGVFGNLGFSSEILKRILIIIPFFLVGTWAIKKLVKQINLSESARFISTLFYLTNTYVLLLIDGGQLTIALAYVFFPLAYLAIEQSILGDYKKKVLAGLLISAVGFFDIRFIYILFLLSLLRFLYEFLFLNPKEWIYWILSWIRLGMISAPLVIGLNFYWLFILFKIPLSNNAYITLTQTSFTSFITLGHSLLMLSPHWFKNVFGQTNQLFFEFTLIPILVFLAPILKPKNRVVGFWLLVAVLSIFLTKGSSEPFTKFYPWLYSNIPGFSLFRDSSKFFFLTALSYTVLIGVTIDEIIKRIRDIKIKALFKASLIVYLLFLVRPIIFGWMIGTFSTPPFQKEHFQLSNILENTPSSNVFWLPTISPLTSLSSTHPALEAVRLAQKRPFASATVGTYETFNYLREASYMGQLFDVANVGYIAYPFLDIRRETDPDKIKYYYTFLNQLSNLPWLQKVEESKIPLLKVKTHQDKLFISSNAWWVVGSDEIYKESTSSSKLSLSKNALIFAEEFAGLGESLDKIPSAKILLYNKKDLDLAAVFLKDHDLIFPAKNLNHDPDTSGWWKRDATDLINWKDFLKAKYAISNQDFDLGGGWAVGERNLSLKIKNDKFKKGNILLARVMESSQGGRLSFSQGGSLIGILNTRSSNTNVRWFEVGKLVGTQDITITTEGAINVINILSSLSQSAWQSYKDKAKSYENKIINFKPENIDEDSSTVAYKEISPTKYIVSIRNLKKPSILIFAQSFNNNWKLNNQAPFPVYSLLNGFSVDKDGQYELEFVPQKYVPFGLVISLLILFTSLGILLV